MNCPTESIPAVDRTLLERAAVYCEEHDCRDVSPSWIQQISREEGIDFATSLLYHIVTTSEKVRGFDAQSVNYSTGLSRLLLAVVPGAFYVEHPETGADGRRLREAAESLGYETELIATASVGTLATNSEAIVNWLQLNGGRKIVLASFSKGGADVKMALRHAPEAFDNVIGWINIGGTTAGSPIVAWILSRRVPRLIARTLFWWKGRDMQFLYDLNRDANGGLDFTLRLPPRLLAIHVVGFPLRRHLSNNRARTWHRRLSDEGPNDGASILTDSCLLPGIVYPVWGADHYAAGHVDWQSFTREALQYFERESESASLGSCRLLAKQGV